MHASPLAGPRAEILSLVRHTPGLTPVDVARAYGWDHSTAAYHLRRLERARLVASAADGRHRRYFANGCGICPFLRAALPVLRDPRYAELVAALEGRTTRVPDLAQDPTAASRLRARLDRLRGLGLVQNVRGTWVPTPETAVCRERAAGTGACDLWGRCPVSQTWRDGDARSHDLDRRAFEKPASTAASEAWAAENSHRGRHARAATTAELDRQRHATASHPAG